MKIAVPTSNNLLCPHFGHCDEFQIFEIDSKTKNIVKKEAVVPPPHEPGLLPRWLKGLGVTHILAGGMGQRAQEFFTSFEIEVVTGAPVISSDELVKVFLEGKLNTGKNICTCGH